MSTHPCPCSRFEVPSKKCLDKIPRKATISSMLCVLDESLYLNFYTSSKIYIYSNSKRNLKN